MPVAVIMGLMVVCVIVCVIVVMVVVGMIVSVAVAHGLCALARWIGRSRLGERRCGVKEGRREPRGKAGASLTC